MGITSIIGIAISVGVILFGITNAGDLGNFIEPVSALLVFVPTVFSLVASFPLSVITKVPSHFKVILGKGYQPELMFDRIYAMARKTRQEGLLSIENEDMGDPILQHGVSMIVDGLPEQEIKRSLEDNLTALKERHTEAVSIYEKGAAFAPAFGMIGTLVGLINMLAQMDFDDSEAIGKLGFNMAVALITTFYGSFLANVVFMPIANRLKTLHKKEMFGKMMICNGLLAIARGDNPNTIIASLRGQLNDAMRKKIPNPSALGSFSSPGSGG